MNFDKDFDEGEFLMLDEENKSLEQIKTEEVETLENLEDYPNETPQNDKEESEKEDEVRCQMIFKDFEYFGANSVYLDENNKCRTCGKYPGFHPRTIGNQVEGCHLFLKDFNSVIRDGKLCNEKYQCRVCGKFAASHPRKESVKKEKENKNKNVCNERKDPQSLNPQYYCEIYWSPPEID